MKTKKRKDGVNKVCATCTDTCKQFAWVTILRCPDYKKKPSKDFKQTS